MRQFFSIPLILLVLVLLMPVIILEKTCLALRFVCNKLIDAADYIINYEWLFGQEGGWRD